MITRAGARHWLALHGLLLVYSLAGVLSKLASRQVFLSAPFLGLYAGVLIILALYALAWQQLLKVLPLTVAFANKAVVMVWGILWGVLFFDEPLRWGMAAGAVLVFAGILLVVTDHD